MCIFLNSFFFVAVAGGGKRGIEKEVVQVFFTIAIFKCTVGVGR